MPLDAEQRLRREGLRRQRRAQDPQPPLPRRQHRAVRAAAARPAVQGPRRRFRRPRRARRLPAARTRRSASTSSACKRAATIDGELLGPLRPELPTLEAGRDVPGRGGGPHARPRPPVQPGDGRLERDLGRLEAKAGGKVIGRNGGAADRTRRRGRPVVALHQRAACSTATATASTAATRRTSSPRSTTSRSRRARGQVVHFGLDVPDGRRRAGRARRRGSATGSSTTST